MEFVSKHGIYLNNQCKAQWKTMIFFPHFRPIFHHLHSRLLTTDKSNWPKVSVVYLNCLFFYTSLLSLKLLQMQQQCVSVCSVLAVIARGEQAKALCKAPMWLRGNCSPCSLKCCLLDREVDLDETRASFCHVGRNCESKGSRCLPTSHYLDLMANCH